LAPIVRSRDTTPRHDAKGVIHTSPGQRPGKNAANVRQANGLLHGRGQRAAQADDEAGRWPALLLSGPVSQGVAPLARDLSDYGGPWPPLALALALNLLALFGVQGKSRSKSKSKRGQTVFPSAYDH
jgi:hypothetical protein